MARKYTPKQADNGTWYVHWSDGRRSKRQSLGTKDGTEAQIRLAKWILTQQNGGDEQVDYEVGRLWAVYCEKHDVVASATRDYAWKNLGRHFGRMRLSDVDEDAVTLYAQKRMCGTIGQPAGESTAHRELAALRACFNWCAAPKRRIIDPAQVPVFDLPAEGEPRTRWLTRGEIDRLLDAADAVKWKPPHGNYADMNWLGYGLTEAARASRGERFLRLALETAARKTAIMELTWDRVDFETGMIDYNVPGRRKTKKRRANVPISKALRPHLERWYDDRINGLVLDDRGDIWATVQIIARRAGFGDDTPPKRKGAKPRATGISPHVLRHTAATHMARNGVPLHYVAGVLGNSLAVVEKVYAKHCPERLQAAVDSISEMRT